MSDSWQPETSTEVNIVRRKMAPGLRNALLSLGLCAGLIVAYYVAVDRTPIPVDTRISFQQSGCGGTCAIARIIITADGATTIQTLGGTRSAVMSKIKLRRLLLTFTHAGFLDKSVDAYSAAGAQQVCQLGLTEGHRKTALRYDCAHPPTDIAPLVTELRQAIK